MQKGEPMINFLPQIYENELLISILKRYYARSGHIQSSTSLEELFNTFRVSIHTHMPTNLNILVSNIPSEFNITSDDLIDKHTLFNYYTAFAGHNRKEEFRQRMKQEKGNAYKITKYNEVALNRHFKYCPQCVSEQLEKTGEFYWNRIHQVSFMCTKHKEVLLESNCKANNKDLTYHIPDINVSSIGNKKDIIFLEKLFRISKRIEQLAINSSNFTHEEMRAIYFEELNKREFVYKSKNQVYIKELEKRIIEYFGIDVLKAVTQKEDSIWINKLLHNHSAETHPLYHILMQAFLDLNLSALKPLEEDNNKILPLIFCKNPLAAHYEKEQIQDVKMHYCSDKKDFMCTFTCFCGFVYTTAYEDVIKSDGEKIGKIKVWGQAYEKELIKLRHLGIKGIARQTGVNHSTIRKHLRNYEQYGYIERVKQNKVKKHEDIEKRHEMIELEETDVQRMSQKNTLLEDKWREKDSLYYEKVSRLLEYERNSTEKPIWLTKTRIAKDIGAVHAIVYNLNKMQRTKELIEKNVESKEDWIKRKISWGIKRLEEDNEEVLTWKIIKDVGLSGINFEKIDKWVHEKIAENI